MLKSEFTNDDRCYHQGAAISTTRGLLFDDIFDPSLGTNTFVATRRDPKLPAKTFAGSTTRRVHGSQDVNLSTCFHRNQSDCSYDDIVSMCSSSPEGEIPSNETLRGDNPLDLSMYEPQISSIREAPKMKSSLLDDMEVPMIDLGEAFFSSNDEEGSAMTSQRSIYNQQAQLSSDVFFSSGINSPHRELIPEISRPLTTPPPPPETENHHSNEHLRSNELIPVHSISSFRSEPEESGYQATAFKVVKPVKRKVSEGGFPQRYVCEPSRKSFKPSEQFEEKITNFIRRVSCVFNIFSILV